MKPPAGDIYLIAAAGNPNFGDEVIVRAWLTYLASTHPQRAVWLDCPAPGRAAILFAGVHPNLRTTDTLWSIVRRFDHGEAAHPEPSVAAVRGWIRDLGTPREDLGILTARQVASIHLVGGGYINDLWQWQKLLPVAAQAIKELDPSIRLYGTGLGLMPQNDAWVETLRDTFAAFDFVDVRDRASAELLGLREGLDDAFLALELQGSQPIFRSDDAPNGMVLVQQDLNDRGSASEYARATARRLLDAGISADSEVGVVESIPPQDAWILPEFRAVWPGPIRFFPFGELWDAGLPAKPSQYWVTSRFHFHLLAAAAGARGTAFDVHPGYYDVKHKSLLELGTGWDYSEDLLAEPDLGRTPESTTGEFRDQVAPLSRARLDVARRLYPRSRLPKRLVTRVEQKLGRRGRGD